MSTARSWTDLRSGAADLRALLAFRGSGLSAQSRRRLWLGGALVGGLTLVAVLVPAYALTQAQRGRAGQVLALLPSLSLGFLALASLTAIASAGGREVVPRDQAVAFPVSTTTEHLGALLLAPLNVAWVLQALTLLGAASYAAGPRAWPLAVLPVLTWIVLATAVAQVVGWLAEGVRRGAHGRLVFRSLTVLLVGSGAALVATHRVTSLLDHSPTRLVLDAVLAGLGHHWWTWAGLLLGLLVTTAVAVLLGGVPARWALRRPMREELRLESGRHPARRPAASDLAMVLRVDRAAVWRSLPLRRGLAVLAVMPGAVALAGGLEWSMLTVLPGLVASGGALLFGVNTWCLDGRGALWRESLPVSPSVVFHARVVVLLEVLLVSATATLLLAALRAGSPTAGEAAALLGSTVVVCVQVVDRAMRWSHARPYAVDLRSARATPAPPAVMAGYSARLALATTLTGLVFSGLAQVGQVGLTLAVVVTMLAWSLLRIERSAARWADPVERSAVVAVVTG